MGYHVVNGDGTIDHGGFTSLETARAAAQSIADERGETFVVYEVGGETLVTVAPRRYAAIGTDGLRPVVWGVGFSEDAAEADALTGDDVPELFYRELTTAELAMVIAGDVGGAAESALAREPMRSWELDRLTGR